MTLAQMEKRLTKLERMVGELVTDSDYRQSVAAIREGLESANRGEGQKAKAVFAEFKRKYRLDKIK